MSETNKYNNETQLPFRKSHAFIIGINNYSHLVKLTTAVNDAKKLGEILATKQGFEVHYLLDASKSEIKDLLENTMIKKVREDDRVLFYFAGHGIFLDEENVPKGYIFPADADRTDKSKLISMEELHDAINELPCRHLLLILDCSFSGAFKWSSGYR